MLGRDHKGSLEVLLVKRNKSLAFAGGLWVFPGGKIDPEDLAQSQDELGAAQLAGVRELKEEVNLDLDPDQLFFFRHWTTPVVEPRRYATYFFFGASDSDTTDVKVDDEEIVAHKWLSPQEALDSLAAGKMGMMPPTILSLQLIRKCQSVIEAKEWISQQTPLFILPELKAEGKRMICLFEGDGEYGSQLVSPSFARHRLTLNMITGLSTFEYVGCGEGIEPVNGGMHV